MSMPQTPLETGMVGFLREWGAAGGLRGTSVRYGNGGEKTLVGAIRCTTGSGPVPTPTAGNGDGRLGSGSAGLTGRNEQAFRRVGGSVAPSDSRYHAAAAPVNDPNTRSDEMLARRRAGRVTSRRSVGRSPPPTRR